MITGGIEGILAFYELLEKKGVKIIRLDKFAPDYLTVSFALVSARVEVDFYIDRVEYNAFLGNEDIHTDLDGLMKLFADHWDS